MKFKKLYEKHDRCVSTAGEQYKKEYQLDINSNGEYVLKECGKTDLQEYIQSHADSVDINLMIERYTMGDTDALNKIQGFYADVSGMPVSMVDMLNIHNKGKMLFETLPQEIRKVYDNNYVKFLQSPDLYEKMRQQASDSYVDKSSEKKDSEEKVNDES